MGKNIKKSTKSNMNINRLIYTNSNLELSSQFHHAIWRYAKIAGVIGGVAGHEGKKDASPTHHIGPF